jgi:hypothetical protein
MMVAAVSRLRRNNAGVTNHMQSRSTLQSNIANPMPLLSISIKNRFITLLSDCYAMIREAVLAPWPIACAKSGTEGHKIAINALRTWFQYIGGTGKKGCWQERKSFDLILSFQKSESFYFCNDRVDTLFVFSVMKLGLELKFIAILFNAEP